MGPVTHKLQRAGTAVAGAGSARDLRGLGPIKKDPIFRLVSLYAGRTRRQR